MGPSDESDRGSIRGDAEVHDADTLRSGESATPAGDAGASRAEEGDADDEPSMPARLGRFTPMRRLGAGAMGVVYSAYDELLDRRVALKVLRRDRGPDAQARMLQEAQALARLSHPNVVQIYDVGQREGRLFLAMEFVRGRTLREWLSQETGDGDARSLAELVAIFAQAGEGLAAAHAAGVIHRDFKPDNVLVGDDGRARVVDFGLAAAGRSTPEVVDRGDVEVADLDGLTRTGALLGTPAYMPPEQLLGGVVDARADVFSFCVALFEAVTGERPFEGRSVGARFKSIHEGPPRAALGGAPPWLRAAIERGLAAEPAARWPTMRSLLDALAQDPVRVRRRWLALAVVAAVAGALAVALASIAEARALRCEAASAEVATIWDEPARVRVREAFTATGVVHAGDTAARVVDRLDAWSSEWRRARAGLCVAEERGDRLARAEVTCLKGHQWRLRALVDALAAADAATVNRAVSAVVELPPIARCSDLRRLRVDDAGEVEVDDPAAREGLARTRGLLSAGAVAAARDAVAPLVDASAPAIRAEALMLSGAIDRQLGDVEPAIERLEAAYYLAGEVGADVVAAEAAVLVMAAVGASSSRHDEGLAWGRSAKMMIGRAGLAEAELGARYLVTLGVIERQRGDYDGALADYGRALAIFRRDLGPRHPSVARALNNIANVLVERRDPAGIDRLREALAIFEDTYGPEHPDVAIFLSNLGAALSDAGRLAEARPLLERSLAISVANFGADHPHVVDARVNYGHVLAADGDLVAALAVADQARAALAGRPASREHAYLEVFTGEVLHRLGRDDEATAALAAAEALVERFEVPSLVPRIRFLQAKIRWDRGEEAEARALAAEALVSLDAEKGEVSAVDEVRRWVEEHRPADALVEPAGADPRGR